MSRQESAQLAATARWVKWYNEKEKKEKEVKRRMDQNIVTTQHIAEEAKRSNTSVLAHAKLLEIKPTGKIQVGKGRRLTWNREDAQRIIASLAKAIIKNANRKYLAKSYRPRKRQSVEPTANLVNALQQKPEQKEQAPIGKWLKLQMEQAGITYCLYQKDNGIIIRRQVVTEEEEKYE